MSYQPKQDWRTPVRAPRSPVGVQAPPKAPVRDALIQDAANRRDQIFLDRGATIVMASLEVGPYIKDLVKHTQVPSYVVNAASWYMRRNGFWAGHNRSQTLNYDWQRAHEAGDADAGHRAMQDAAVAVGLMEVSYGPGGTRQYEPRNRVVSRNVGDNYKFNLAAPPCGSALALGRHRLFNENCVDCETAAAERHRIYAARQKELRANVLARRASIEQRKSQESLAEQRYEAFIAAEATEAQGKRNVGLKEYHAYRAAGLTLKRPKEIRLDKPTGRDRIDSGWTSDVVGAQGSRHLTEWADPTFDAVANLLEHETSERAVVALEYRALLPEHGERAEWPNRRFIVDHNHNDYRVGFSVASE